MAQTIVLTGFMGTGKTTVGRLLAARTGRAFVDTDELIELQAGKSIADIFADEGPAAFRRMEAEMAQTLSGRENMVIATGGRLMLDPDNAEVLGASALVICLTADPEEILARLETDPTRRPLLDVEDPAGRVQELLDRRAELYGQFPQLSTGGKTAAQVAEAIMARWDLAAQPRTRVQTSNRITVTHPAGRYDVVVGQHLLSWLADLADVQGPFVVITDSTVGPLYAAQIDGAARVLTIPAGERHKTLDTVRGLYDGLLAAGLDRSGTVVALGGGVVGDVAGFVAATYMRGVRLVQCPTTLLAMVDASVGGKTGVDLPQGKNLVGAFKQPAAVLADVGTARTLPPAEFAAGMAEVVKHGLIAERDLFRWLEQRKRPLTITEPALFDNLQFLITRAIEVKRDVVEADPFEQGRRAVLNLGHTFAHAIEQVSGYAVRHGEAVAMGLVCAAHLSARLGHCGWELQPRIEGVLEKVYLPIRVPAGLPPGDLLQAMGRDKKKAAGQLRFILLRGVGDVFVTADVPEAEVLETLQMLRE